MASTDKFNKVISGTTRPVATTLSAQKLSGATSFTVVAATGWETTTAVHGIMYRTDAGTGEKVAGSQIDWKGDVSGTTVSNVTVTAGTDDTYAIGTTVELAPTAAWGDDIATGILVEHNQDGTHGAVTATSVATDTITEDTAAAGVTIDGLLIKDSKLATNDSVVETNITNAIISNEKLKTGAGQPGGSWTTWTPTLSGMTLGNGSVIAKYTQIGKTVHFRFAFTFGASGSAMADGSFSAPVTAASDYGFADIVGPVRFEDANGTDTLGICRLESTTSIRPIRSVASTADSSEGGVSSTAPFTWANGDRLIVQGTYEAA